MNYFLLYFAPRHKKGRAIIVNEKTTTTTTYAVQYSGSFGAISLQFFIQSLKQSGAAIAGSGFVVNSVVADAINILAINERREDINDELLMTSLFLPSLLLLTIVFNNVVDVAAAVDLRWCCVCGATEYASTVVIVGLEQHNNNVAINRNIIVVTFSRLVL